MWRAIEILKIFQDTECITLKNLAIKLDVNIKTLKKGILTLNRQLSDYNCQILIKEASCWFSAKNAILIPKIISQIILSLPYLSHPYFKFFEIYFRLFSSNGNVTLSSLASEFSLSTSTIKREITNLNKVIKLMDQKFSIKNSKTRGLYLEGDELSIRLFIYQLLDIKSDPEYNLLWLERNKEWKKLYDVIFSNLKNNTIDLSIQTKLAINLSSYVQRIIQEKLLKENFEIYIISNANCLEWENKLRVLLNKLFNIS